MTHWFTTEKAGYTWLFCMLISVLVLPWYKVAPQGAESVFSSAVFHALAGRDWLWPIVLAVLILLVIQRYGARLIHWMPFVAVLLILSYAVFQAALIGLNGPLMPWINTLFQATAHGQTGLGIGGLVFFVATLGFLSHCLALSGFCKGDRFASAAVVFIATLLGLFVFFPIIKLGMAAFATPEGGFGLQSFWQRATAADLWRLDCIQGSGRCGVVINTLVLGVSAALTSTLLGLGLALLVARTDFRYKRSLRVVAILPIITPPFVVGVAIIVLFGRTGLVTTFLADLFDFTPSRWLYGLPGILIAQTLAFAPVTFLVLLSTLEAINPTLEEASKTLGAKPLQTFRTVTLPLLRPGLAAAFLLAFIESLADFGNPIVLGGGYEVLSTKIFFSVVGARYDLGDAATLSIILLMLTLGAFWLQNRWLGKKSYVTVTGKSDAGLASPLPSTVRVASYAVVIPFVFLTLAVYSIVLLGGFVNDIGRWDLSPTFHHLNTAFSFDISSSGVELYGSAWSSLKTTLWVSALAAPFTAAIGILTAWLVTRQQFAGRRQFEFGTMLSFAIPGTVVGVSYVAAFNVPPVDITGTLIILVICFTFRNMPVGMRAGMAALSQIDRSMEEASQTLGAGSRVTLQKVVLPLIKPAIFTALVYAFVTAMTAVSAVIFLVSARHNMATAYIMGRVENGEYALAITYSAVLMLVMMACIAAMGWMVGRRTLGRRSELRRDTATNLANGNAS